MEWYWWLAIIIAIIVAVLLVVLFIAYSIIFQLRWIMKIPAFIFPHALFYFSTKQKAIALTVDDAPTDQTEQFLELFKRFGVHATFFVIGNRVRGREEKMRAIIEGGHEIGNHTICDEPSFMNTLEEFKSKVGEVSTSNACTTHK